MTDTPLTDAELKRMGGDDDLKRMGTDDDMVDAEFARKLERKLAQLMKAARKVRPIVGAAVASASNEGRQLRQSAYDQLVAAIEAKDAL